MKKIKAQLYIRKYWQLYALLLLPAFCFFLFKLLPIAGNVIAFRRYRMGQSVFGVEWVGFRYFQMFMRDPSFWRAFTNTLTLSVTNLVCTFPIPIIFALLLNEVRNAKAKKFIQTVTYLPRFFSTVVIISMMTELMSPTTGIINKAIQFLGGNPIYFMGEPEWFRFNYVLSDAWQFTGKQRSLRSRHDRWRESLAANHLCNAPFHPQHHCGYAHHEDWSADDPFVRKGTADV